MESISAHREAFVASCVIPFYKPPLRISTRRPPREPLADRIATYFFEAFEFGITRVRARSTVPIARPKTLPTARPTVLALRLELEERLAAGFEVFCFTLAALAVVVDFEVRFFGFLLMTCAAGSISLLGTPFLTEGDFLRGWDFFSTIFRMVPPWIPG